MSVLHVFTGTWVMKLWLVMLLPESTQLVATVMLGCREWFCANLIPQYQEGQQRARSPRVLVDEAMISLEEGFKLIS